MNAPYDLSTLAVDLLTEAKVNLTSNNIVIPVLQCFNLLLENDIFEEAAADAMCLSRSVVTLTSSACTLRYGDRLWLMKVAQQLRDAYEHSFKKYLPYQERTANRHVDAHVSPACVFRFHDARAC